MALIKCEECGKEISDKASDCHHCGAPISLVGYHKTDDKAHIDEKEEQLLKGLAKRQEEKEANREKRVAKVKESNEKFITTAILTLGVIFALVIYSCSGPEVKPTEAIKTQEQISQDLLWSQFSSYDGSHAALVAKVKNSMNNPDSFEHVDTVYYWTDETKQSTEDKITVKMTYRGTNGFGGVVTETVMAQVDTHGNVLEVLGQ